MQALIDFANHGILPFIGREREVERILSFCAASFDVHRLRAAIIVGEAGIGKSRLFDEVLPQCERREIVVIRAKLHPDSATSLIPFIARSISAPGELRQIIRKETEETLTSVVAALQRLARLRRVMLVVEDIHLLRGDAAGEFARIVTALADEPLALLCSARPMELTARGVLEPYLTLELELHGLNTETVDMLWRRLFGRTDSSDLLDQLVRKTTGNPLALRSALRSAVKAEETSRVDGEVRLRFDRPGFVGSLERNVRLLAEGMAAHLRDDERHVARDLASLGELFSREAARAMLGDQADRLIESLIFKGVITESSSTVTAITGNPSVFPVLSFTHSLLHNFFAEEARTDSGKLLSILVASHPLFSILPYKKIEEAPVINAADDDIVAAIRHARATALNLEETADWQLGQMMWGMIDRLMKTPLDSLDPIERVDLRNFVLEGRLLSMRRRDHTDEYLAVCNEFMLATEDLPESLAYQHVRALIHLYRYKARRAPTELADITAMIDREFELCPALKHTHTYVLFISTQAITGSFIGDDLLQREAERKLNELLSWDVPKELKDQARFTALPVLLTVFDSEEELQRRLKQVEELQQEFELHSRHKDRLQIQYGEILLTTADVDRAIPHAEEMIRRFREQALYHVVHHFTIGRLMMRAFIGEETLESFDRNLTAHSATMPAALSPVLDPFSGYMHSMMLILFGAIDNVAATAQRYPGGMSTFTLPMVLLYQLHQGYSVASVRQNEVAGACMDYTAGLLIEALAEDGLKARQAALRLLAYPLLRYDVIISYHAIIRLIEARIADGEETIWADLDGAITEALRRTLQWFTDRRFFPLIPPLVNDFSRYLSQVERKQWNDAAEAMAAEFRQTHESRTVMERRIRLTMLGRVEFHLSDHQIIPVRGLRMKAVLGLLVADLLARKPLSKQQFYMLAAGDEAKDFELARKTVNMALAAVRKLIGFDIFTRDEDTLRLDLQTISVDLLEAADAVTDSLTALRERSYARARASLTRALTIAAGEVPFPSLYDTYFEAAREDFETRLRHAVVEVSRALLREGDIGGAEGLLEIGFEWQPEDEEIGELLQQALVAADRRAEAERIRLRSVMEMAV